MFQDKVYHLSEDTKQMPIDNHVHTMDDLEAVLHQDDFSNDVLPSIVDDQTQRSKSKKHRRTRKGARMYTAYLMWTNISRCQ
jgi:hypothetical protein